MQFDSEQLERISDVLRSLAGEPNDAITRNLILVQLEDLPFRLVCSDQNNPPDAPLVLDLYDENSGVRVSVDGDIWKGSTIGFSAIPKSNL